MLSRSLRSGVLLVSQLAKGEPYIEEERESMIIDPHEDDDDEELDDDESTEDDFRERVAWQSKYEAKACFGCGKAFNPITNRHHHCRSCGRVVCGDCSEHRDKVKGYSKRQRTCDECHEQIANQFTLKKLIGLLCPCLKLLKREMRKARSAQLLYDGAVFIRKGKHTKSVGKLVKNMKGWFNKEAPKKQKSSEESDSPTTTTSSRVKVKLRPDGLALTLSPVGAIFGGEELEEIYLHDARSVEAKGSRGIRINGANDAMLFQGDMADKFIREEWLKALQSALIDAKAKPPPPRISTSGNRLQFAVNTKRKEIELQSKKRDAEKKKESYLKGSKGLKYTALAMAEREKNAPELV